MHRRFGALTVLSIVAVVLLAACQPAAPPPTAKEPAGVAPAAKAPAAKPAAPTRLVVGIVDPLDAKDPLDHSNTFLYPFWCEVLGCLFGWDPKTGEPVPQLAESWKVENPTTWVFNLRKNVKWHDSSPFTAHDVVYTLQRVLDHPKGRQKYLLATVAKFEAVNDDTVKMVTKEPNSALIDNVFVNNIAMMSKAQGDRGEDLAKVNAVGTGAYMLKEHVSQQRFVVAKNPNWWRGPVQGPDEIVYRPIKEDAPRVTALLNGEIQIAEKIPVQDVDRVNASPNLRVDSAVAITNNFLAMRPDTKPWDNKLVRQAVAYAIDRDAIIKNVFQGYAERLDGPIGPGQYSYDSELAKRLHKPYDPAKARQLLAQAGYPNGVDVELTTPVGFYVKDKEVAEAMLPMLNEVGIRAKLVTGEFATTFTNIQQGKVPFYYFGRGGFRDPGGPLSQYLETGVSKRIENSNPKLDELFRKERASFDPNERKKLLGEVMAVINEDVPAHFLWRSKLLWGVAKNIEWTPRSDEAIFGSDMRVK